MLFQILTLTTVQLVFYNDKMRIRVEPDQIFVIILTSYVSLEHVIFPYVNDLDNAFLEIPKTKPVRQ